MLKMNEKPQIDFDLGLTDIPMAESVAEPITPWQRTIFVVILPNLIHSAFMLFYFFGYWQGDQAGLTSLGIGILLVLAWVVGVFVVINFICVILTIGIALRPWRSQATAFLAGCGGVVLPYLLYGLAIFVRNSTS